MKNEIKLTGFMAAILLGVGAANAAQIASTNYVDNAVSSKANLSATGTAGEVATIDAAGQYIRSGTNLSDVATTANVNTIVEQAIEDAVDDINTGITDMETKTNAAATYATKIQVGSDVLTTDAKTVTGAVNELDAEIGTVAGNLTTVQNNITNLGTTYATDAEVSAAIDADNLLDDAAYAIKATESVASGAAAAIGTLGNLNTSTKTDTVSAINEVNTAVGVINTNMTGMELTTNKATQIDGTNATSTTQYASVAAVSGYALPKPPTACDTTQCVLSVNSSGKPYWEVVALVNP